MTITLDQGVAEEYRTRNREVVGSLLTHYIASHSERCFKLMPEGDEQN